MVSSWCRRPPRDFAIGLVNLDDSVAIVREQRRSHRFSNLVVRMFCSLSLQSISSVSLASHKFQNFEREICSTHLY
jgi:hypothetical protein